MIHVPGGKEKDDMQNHRMDSPYHVRAVQCDYRSSDDEVYQALKRATDPLTSAWERLKRAQRIGIKFNQEGMPGKVVVYQGHRAQLVSDPVARAVLRLLRERTQANLFVVDVSPSQAQPGKSSEAVSTLLPVLKEYDVPFVDGNREAVQWVAVPGGGQMFEKYPVVQAAVDADEMISVQKLKNHLFMGVTLTVKNLFGLMPVLPHGRTRTYYHHAVRMPYLLADLARLYDPALNIIDGLVCQAGEEWGPGDNPRICNTLIAGDQPVATDTLVTHLMGHDPQSDWLTPPFHRDRNHLLVAAESGYGTVNLHEIDYQSEVEAPLGEFFAKKQDPQETVISVRRTTAEQGLYYRDHKQKFVDQYAGKYILLQMNEVRWSSEEGEIREARRNLWGEHPEQALWFKYVDPEEKEGEHFEVYEKTLQAIPV